MSFAISWKAGEFKGCNGKTIAGIKCNIMNIYFNISSNKFYINYSVLYPELILGIVCFSLDVKWNSEYIYNVIQ